ncbi:hypothetical protein [Priestia abyssalis]|uniref:hypothetical protein n=1 Tax=Priestia abyssalis TaxID=1221450 RepID=UPI0009952228|nr:hypothetical protein [Priestia abyssalis]
MWETIANIGLVIIVFLAVFFFIKKIVNSDKKDLPNSPGYTPSTNLDEGRNEGLDITQGAKIPLDTKQEIPYDERSVKH